MAKSPLQRRRELYSRLSSQIALISSEKLQALLDTDTAQAGWGRTQALKIGPAQVFIKRVPITQLEYDNQFSTQNLYDLPLYYNYGVGSAGFGVFRELVTHIKTTNWVLEGAIATFPLMYHYRLLPFGGARAELDRERHQKYVEYWGSSANIDQYILARANAPYEAVIFLEYIPHTVGPWLSENMGKADALLAQMRETIAFLRKNEIIHFDVHFHNIVTDGKRFYLTDFGLALDKGFDLTPTERAFYARNTEYDYGELISCFGNYLLRMCRQELSEEQGRHLSERYGLQEETGLEELLSVLVSQQAQLQSDKILRIDRKSLQSIAKYHRILILMLRFYFDLRSNTKKDTRFENADLRRLLYETRFLPVFVPSPSL